MKYNSDLLDTLHSLVGCEYMSDLKSNTQRERLLQVISDMDISCFSPAAWEKAICYLFNINVRFHSLEDLRAFVGTHQAAGVTDPATQQRTI